MPAMQETWVQPLVRMIPWRREWLPTPVFLPKEFLGWAMGSQRIGHDWATDITMALSLISWRCWIWIMTDINLKVISVIGYVLLLKSFLIFWFQFIIFIFKFDKAPILEFNLEFQHIIIQTWKRLPCQWNWLFCMVWQWNSWLRFSFYMYSCIAN